MLTIFKVYWICYSIVSVLCFGCEAGEILALQPGSEPTSSALGGEVSTTGTAKGSPPRMLLKIVIK